MFVFETDVHEGEVFLEFFGVRVVLEFFFEFFIKLIDKVVLDLFGLRKLLFLLPELFNGAKIAAIGVGLFSKGMILYI